MEHKFLKDQIELLGLALLQFHLTDHINNSRNDPTLDRFDLTVNSIDIEGIRYNIGLLLLNNDPQKLYVFLNNNFIVQFEEKINILRSFVKKEKLNFGSHAIDYSRRQWLSLRLLSSIETISKIINDVQTNIPSEGKGFQSGLSIEQINELMYQVKEWILPDFVNKYTQLEKELFNRNYIDDKNNWAKSKIKLAEFLRVIIDLRYFKHKKDSSLLKDFHKRQFIEERYGYEKSGLSNTWEKFNRKVKASTIAKSTFYWIVDPN